MFHILDPKPRRIAAPAFEDRVLHHAIMQVIEPELERVAIFHSYACRRGKGTFRAVKAAQTFARRNPCFLQLDVRKYFDSIDHEVMRYLLARRFKDRDLLGLLDGLLASYSTLAGKGIPIGSLTSQHLANFYLSPLDHFATEVLRVPGYVRYMDDFVLFGPSQSVLAEWRMAIVHFLERSLRLQIKNAGALNKTQVGIGFLGMLVLPTHIRLMEKSKRRVRSKWIELVKGGRRGSLGPEALGSRTVALLARTYHVKARGLRAAWTREFAELEV